MQIFGAHKPRYRHKRIKPSKHDKGGASRVLKGRLLIFFEMFKGAKLPERGATTGRLFEL